MRIGAHDQWNGEGEWKSESKKEVDDMAGDHGEKQKSQDT